MFEKPLEHHIQRDIIVRLSLADSLKFSELKPPKLENNHYVYHLNLLIKDGLIQKKGTKYQLAPSGLRYVDQLSYKSRRPRWQPKIVSMLIINDSKGKYLLAERKVQPFYGYYGLVTGKQHYEEMPIEHAARELSEKTNLSLELTQAGTANIKITQQGKTISHVAANIFTGYLENVAALEQKDQRFEILWLDPKKTKNKLVPGTREIINIIENNNGKLVCESMVYELPDVIE